MVSVCGARVEVVGGSVVVVKAAEGPAAAALRAEGERLRAAAHAGVVAVVDSTGTDARWELRVAHGGRPATLLHPATPAQVASIAGAVADTLADLHDRGVVHGRLAARHVLVGADGEVRLCGFGAGGDATPQDDIAAVGGIITELLGGREEPEPLPELRWHRRAPWPGVARRALLSLAVAATAEPPSRRPSARRLAASIRAAVPDERVGRRRRRAGPAAGGPPRNAALQPPTTATAAASQVRLLDRDDPSGARPEAAAVRPVPRRLGRRPGPPARHRRSPARGSGWRAAAVAALGASLLVAGAWRSLGSDSHDPAEGPAAPSPPNEPCAVVDLGGGACQPVRVHGGTVSVGTVTFQVGQPGDEVVVGDWDCDGQATVALRRPGTGEVFLFPGWAADGALEVPPTLVVPRAVALRAPDGPCGPPEVVRDDGTVLTVPQQGGRA